MTIPHVVLYGLGSVSRIDVDKIINEILNVSKSTSSIEREFFDQDKVVTLSDQIIIEATPRNNDKVINEILNVVKTTSAFNRERFSRAKSITLIDSIPTPTATARPTIDRVINETIGASKTTGEVDTAFPDNFQGVLDQSSCPGPVITCDLTWDLGTATGYTMTLDRFDGSWATVDASITAGLEAYSDTNATETTSKYRIKLNISGASWIEDTVMLICPI